MKSELVHEALNRLDTEDPQSVLIVAPEVPVEFDAFSNAHSNARIMHLAANKLEDISEDLERFDFVLVFNTLENLTRQSAERLVSRLRDLHSRLLWVAVADAEHHFNCEDAVAQGMRMVNPAKFATGDTQWYEFSLRFYKPAPQWLNARDWANPDRWDKDRW